MALTSSRIAVVAEIVRESYDSVASAVSSLNSSQEAILVADIETWKEERNSIDLKFKGEGVDLDSERLLAKIFYRTRSMLGYPLIAYDLDAPTMSLIELEVGHNFG